MKKTILFFTAILAFVQINAIHPIVRNFTRDTYQSGTQNWKITQSDSEIMYFANNNGLLEFDGRKWSTFPIANYTNVRSVLATSDRRIYVGAFNEFGYFEEDRAGKMTYFSLKHLVNDIQDLHEIWEIHQSDKGDIYFQSDYYVFKYSENKIKYEYPLFRPK